MAYANLRGYPRRTRKECSLVPHAITRCMLPLGLTDDEFGEIMRAFYRGLLRRQREDEAAQARWENEGGSTEAST